MRKSNLILGAIFPGVLSALVETIKSRKSSKILAKAFELYIDLVVIFIVTEPAERRVKNLKIEILKFKSLFYFHKLF